MKSGNKIKDIKGILPELSEKNLNEITRDIGNKVRSQTIEQKERLKRDLKNQLTATRKAFSKNVDKNSKT